MVLPQTKYILIPHHAMSQIPYITLLIKDLVILSKQDIYICKYQEKPPVLSAVKKSANVIESIAQKRDKLEIHTRKWQSL